MSHIIILSDSEDEMEIDMAPGSSASSSPTDSSSESEEIISEIEYMSESEPEEQSKSATPPVSPPHMAYHYTGPRTINTPRKRVAVHRRQRGKSPVIALPGDPYQRPLEEPRKSPKEDANVGWVGKTLADWRKLDIFPSIHEAGECSNAREKDPVIHESPEEILPIVIAHTSRQDNRLNQHDDRLDHIEDALTELPTMDTMEEIDQTVNTMAFQMSGIHDVTVDLKDKVEENTNQIQNLERRMNGIPTLERQLDAARANITELKHKTTRDAVDTYLWEERLYQMGIRMEEMDATLKELVATVKKITDSRK